MNVAALLQDSPSDDRRRLQQKQQQQQQQQQQQTSTTTTTTTTTTTETQSPPGPLTAPPTSPQWHRPASSWPNSNSYSPPSSAPAPYSSSAPPSAPPVPNSASRPRPPQPGPFHSPTAPPPPPATRDPIQPPTASPPTHRLPPQPSPAMAPLRPLDPPPAPSVPHHHHGAGGGAGPGGVWGPPGVPSLDRDSHHRDRERELIESTGVWARKDHHRSRSNTATSSGANNDVEKDDRDLPHHLMLSRPSHRDRRDERLSTKDRDRPPPTSTNPSRTQTPTSTPTMNIGRQVPPVPAVGSNPALASPTISTSQQEFRGPGGVAVGYGGRPPADWERERDRERERMYPPSYNERERKRSGPDRPVLGPPPHHHSHHPPPPPQPPHLHGPPPASSAPITRPVPPPIVGPGLPPAQHQEMERERQRQRQDMERQQRQERDRERERLERQEQQRIERQDIPILSLAPRGYQPQGPPPREAQAPAQVKFHTQFVPALNGSRVGSPVRDREHERERERELREEPARAERERNEALARDRDRQRESALQREREMAREREDRNRERDLAAREREREGRAWWSAPPMHPQQQQQQQQGPPPGPEYHGHPQQHHGQYDRERGYPPSHPGDGYYPPPVEPGRPTEPGVVWDGWGTAPAPAAASGPPAVPWDGREVDVDMGSRVVIDEGVAHGVPPVMGEEDDWGPEEEEEEVRARVVAHLGTFVWPNLPFPFYFDVGVGVPGKEPGKDDVEEEKKAKVEVDSKKEKKVDEPMEVDNQSEAEEGEIIKTEEEKPTLDNKPSTPKPDDAPPPSTAPKEKEKYTVDTETRATIIIPNAHIPLERPKRLRIWGGGLPPRPRTQQQHRLPPHHPNPKRPPPPPAQAQEHDPESKPRPTRQRRRRRRIYTDDSDLFLCAIHSGWVTWSTAAKARTEGRDIRIEVRVLRCVGSLVVVGPDGIGMSAGLGMGLGLGMRGREEVVGRFLGGSGERFVGGGGGEEEEDGRGLMSAGWGTGHDGSAVEVVDLQFTEKGTSNALCGLRNRKQRLMEYHERRAHVVGLPPPCEQPLPTTRLVGRKRRRARDWPIHHHLRRLFNVPMLDGSAGPPVLDANAATYITDHEENAQMTVHTVVFGLGLGGDVLAGYKYEPDVLQDVIFPAPTTAFIHPPPPRKRQRVEVEVEADVESPVINPDVSMDAVEGVVEAPAVRPVILETAKESYYLSPSAGGGGMEYDISLILEDEVVEEVEGHSIVVDGAPEPLAGVEGGSVLPPEISNNAVKPQPQLKELKPQPLSTLKEEAAAILDSPSKDLPSQTSDKPAAADAIPTDPEDELTASAADPPPPSSPVAATAEALDSDSKPEKQLLLQTLQRKLGPEMFRFTVEGVYVADGVSEEGVGAEWVVQVKRWRWGPEGQELR